ncbi:MAG TPA: hypothetical protein VND93_00860 [Myxococcales bacterium]|jgi:hypothetical protein|nr:hypothetical protein [Myxococcales bacterium]
MKNEGETTSMVEMQTRQIPSITFLGLALGAMAASALLMLLGKKQTANFIGQWAPSILIMGTYNKIAKTFTAPYDEQQQLRHGDHPAPYQQPETSAPRPLPSV